MEDYQIQKLLQPVKLLSPSNYNRLDFNTQQGHFNQIQLIVKNQNSQFKKVAYSQQLNYLIESQKYLYDERFKPKDDEQHKIYQDSNCNKIIKKQIAQNKNYFNLALTSRNKLKNYQIQKQQQAIVEKRIADHKFFILYQRLKNLIEETKQVSEQKIQLSFKILYLVLSSQTFVEQYDEEITSFFGQILSEIRKGIFCDNEKSKFKEIIFQSDNKRDNLNEDQEFPYFQICKWYEEKIQSSVQQFEQLLDEKEDQIKFYQGRLKKLTDDSDKLRKQLISEDEIRKFLEHDKAQLQLELQNMKLHSKLIENEGEYIQQAVEENPQTNAENETQVNPMLNYKIKMPNKQLNEMKMECQQQQFDEEEELVDSIPMLKAQIKALQKYIAELEKDNNEYRVSYNQLMASQQMLIKEKAKLINRTHQYEERNRKINEENKQLENINQKLMKLHGITRAEVMEMQIKTVNFKQSNEDNSFEDKEKNKMRTFKKLKTLEIAKRIELKRKTQNYFSNTRSFKEKSTLISRPFEKKQSIVQSKLLENNNTLK